jgi:hypothetical protein
MPNPSSHAPCVWMCGFCGGPHEIGQQGCLNCVAAHQSEAQVQEFVCECDTEVLCLLCTSAATCAFTMSLSKSDSVIEWNASLQKSYYACRWHCCSVQQCNISFPFSICVRYTRYVAKESFVVDFSAQGGHTTD